MSNKEYTDKYDVLLSFAGEDRAYVEQVARVLEQNGVRYFYDKNKEIEMWGNDLVQYLQQMYSSGMAQHCVVFISEAYNQKHFPQHELRSALVQELTQHDYILPVFMKKDVGLPSGILPTKMYLIAPESPYELAYAIIKKLRKQISSSDKLDGGDNRTSIRMPRVPKDDFDAYEETEKALFEIQNLLLTFSKEANKKGGIKFTVINRGEKMLFRAQKSGKVLYHLNVWLGDMFGDNTICFYGSWGSPDNIGNSVNGTAQIFWDTKKQSPMFKFQNLSLLDMGTGNFDSISVENLINKIWGVAIDAVEKQIDDN